jgi:hypothetical protein
MRQQQGHGGSGLWAPGWRRRQPVAVGGWLRGPSRMPPSRASRADHRRDRQPPSGRQAGLDMAALALARSPGRAGRRHTGWRMSFRFGDAAATCDGAPD